MTPVDFPEKTLDLQKPPGTTDEECRPLPVYRDGERCISAWRPTWRERLSILFFGRVWLHVWSGRTQPPVLVEGKRSAFEARR